MTGRSTMRCGSGPEPHRRLPKRAGLLLRSALLILLLAGWSGAAAGAETLQLPGLVTLEPEGVLPTEWQLQAFPSIERQTAYTAVRDAEHGLVVKAETAGGAAGLMLKVDIEPERYPLLSWSWKISALMPAASLRHKQGDDFPARLLLSFGNDFFRGGIPQGTLCYVWASHEPVGTVAVSPYRADVTTIVVASGAEHLGFWRSFRRNIVDDYVRAYQQQPGRLRSISLMTDGDNTGAAATSWYGPIVLKTQ